MLARQLQTLAHHFVCLQLSTTKYVHIVISIAQQHCVLRVLDLNVERDSITEIKDYSVVAMYVHMKLKHIIAKGAEAQQ